MPQQTSQNQVARQREHELVAEINANQSHPAVQAMLELAQLKASDAHRSYLKSGPSEERYQRERIWTELAKMIEEGNAVKSINEGSNNG